VTSTDDLRTLARKRERLTAALAQAEFEIEKTAQELREAGVPDADIQEALLGKPAPRLVRAQPPAAPPTPERNQPPPRADLQEGYWGDD